MPKKAREAGKDVPVLANTAFPSVGSGRVCTVALHNQFRLDADWREEENGG